ncbi:MAG: oligosaccharide flippase family protein [Kofleriaceae bacterium]
MTEQAQLQRRVKKSLSWVGLASTAVSILDFVAIVLILRFWLTKAEYGIATKAAWMFAILDYASDLGLSAAVIQRDDHTEEKLSTVFWANVLVSIVMVLALAALHPVFTRFYGHVIVANMALAYGAKLLWQNLYLIPQSLMRKELRYGELSVIRLVGNLGEFSGKVGFAAAGFGPWCLVLGPLCRYVIVGVGTQLRHPWRPRLVCRFRDAADYLRFGFKTSASQMLFYFYTNVDYAIVGRVFGDSALGMYRWAYEVVLEPVRIISDVVREVAFSAFARLRRDPEQLRAQFISFTRLNLFTVLTFLGIVVVAAEEILILTVDAEYLPAAMAIRVLALVGVLRSVGFVVPPLLDGLGFPGRTLIYQGCAAVVLPILYTVAATVLGPSLGFTSVATAWAVGYPIAFAVLMAMALYAVKLRARDYLKAVIGIPLCVAVAVAAGIGAKLLLAGAPVGVRFLGIIVAELAALLPLLTYTQDMGPRAMWRAARGR